MGTSTALQSTLPGLLASSHVDWAKPPVSVPLDNTVQNCTVPYKSCEKQSWQIDLNLKRRRARSFQRSMSGLRVGGRVFMVTLTHSDEAWWGGVDITAAFRAYIMRLRRRKWLVGYMKVREYTRRGRPHIHILMRVGSGVSEPLLRMATSAFWGDLFLSPVIDVKSIWSEKGAAGYLAKYMGKDARARYSYSWDWVWRGFAASWKAVVKRQYSCGRDVGNAVEVWGQMLDFYRVTGLILLYPLRGVRCGDSWGGSR